MIQHRYYAEDDVTLRPSRCWQTWLLWLTVVGIYIAWSYLHITTLATGSIDWFGFWLEGAVFATSAMVVKQWIDLRVAVYRSL